MDSNVVEDVRRRRQGFGRFPKAKLECQVIERLSLISGTRSKTFLLCITSSCAYACRKCFRGEWNLPFRLRKHSSLTFLLYSSDLVIESKVLNLAFCLAMREMYSTGNVAQSRAPEVN